MHRICAALVGLLLLSACEVDDPSIRQATAQPTVATPMQDLFVMIFGLFAIVPVIGSDGELEEILVLFAREDGGQTVANILGSTTDGDFGKEELVSHCPTIVRSSKPTTSCDGPLSGDLLIAGSGSETTLSSEGAIDLTEVLGSAELATAKDSCTGEVLKPKCGAAARIRLRGGSARSLDFRGQPRTLLSNKIDFSLLSEPKVWVGMRSLRSTSVHPQTFPHATMLLFHTTVAESSAGMHPAIAKECNRFRKKIGTEPLQSDCLLQILENIPPGAHFPDVGTERLGKVDHHFLRIYDLLEWEVHDRPVPFFKAKIRGQGNPPGGRCDHPVMAPTFRPSP